MLDIIPDIHGRADMLEGALRALGYAERTGAWRAPGRTALFLGDLIDGKPSQAAEEARTLSIVRGMVEAGTARCLMGNHELNAIHYHWPTDDGGPLRLRDKKNARQHSAFLAEHPLGSPGAREAVDWMMALPLAIEMQGLRAVHACWSADAIATIRKHGEVREANGATAVHLGRDALSAAAMPTKKQKEGGAVPTSLAHAVETALKGPEVRLPDGASFHDKDGNERHHVRVAWWREGAATYRDAAISVPDDQKERIPTTPLASSVPIYPADAPPVVFGHYWMTWSGDLTLPQAPSALCLDFSAGRDGPLVTYAHEDGAPLDAARLRKHDGR